MAFNENNIYRYNFKSKSNIKWNFQLQFLAGSNIYVGVYDSNYLPDIFVSEISILSDFADDLPFGKVKASLLNLKLDFTNLSGDFEVLKEWIMLGGQVISGNFYPNQWRILSNNGRGALDTTFDTVEFWGCQDVLPSQKYKASFGKSFNFDLKILSLENYILNNITSFSFDNGGSTITDQVVNYHNFAGTNSGSQSVRLATYSTFNNNSFTLFNATNFNTNLIDYILIVIDNNLRNWLIQDTSSSNIGVVNIDNTFLQHWNFYKQLYDLTTGVGAGLGSNADVKMVGSVINADNQIIGGLTSNKSKDGFYQFKNVNDILNSICEQFISKLTFKYNRNDTLNSDRLILQFNAPFDSLDGGSISLTLADFVNEPEITIGDFAIAESTVSYKAYKENQNKNSYSVYGSLKNDSFDNKALFQTNVQVGTLDNFLDAVYSEIPYIMINQLFYVRETSEIYLIHANCSVDLYSEGTAVTISNESTSGDTIDPYDNKSNQNKELNRVKLIEWSNKRYNKSGLNYVQSKAYANIMNDKAKLLECQIYDYKLRPREIGQLVNCDIADITNFPTDWFLNNNHLLVSCELDLMTGISKNKLFIMGI
jgi:hypothetical protein